MTKQKKLLIGICGLIGLLIIVYIIGIFYYSNRLLPNTYINDVNYGGKTMFEVKNNIENSNESYTISLIKNDGTTEEINGEDFDYSFEIKDDLENIKNNQNAITWLPAMWGKSNYTIKTKVNYDENKLITEIKKLNCLNSLAIKAPTNAYIEVTEDGYKIIPEDNGNTLKEDVLISKICEAVSKGKTEINLSDEDCYLTAEVTKDDSSITKVIEKVDSATNLTITYKFGEDTEVIDSKKISSWVTFDEDYNISFEDAKIKQYVKNLASKYDTYGMKRKFKTTSGEEISINSGILGWQIDVDKTVEEIKEFISAGEDITDQPEYKLYCLTRDNQDIGNTYIEVSIDKQHLWFYKDGELNYESDVVTGLPNGQRDTPKGAYVVWSREKGATLGTYAVQGYEVWVDYWMPFDWTGCGLHDSNKRNFGGEVYKTNGSHGCINCPKETAKYLYENIKTGTPVIIY